MAKSWEVWIAFLYIFFSDSSCLPEPQAGGAKRQPRSAEGGATG